MPRPYRMRLMFEWGGGCIWSGDEASRRAIGVGAIEEKLKLSESLRPRLAELSEWHDEALNWDSPTEASPWTTEERQRFEAAATEVLARLRAELGSNFEVV